MSVYSKEFLSLSPDARSKIEAAWVKADGRAVKIGGLVKAFGLRAYEVQEIETNLSGEMRPPLNVREPWHIALPMYEGSDRKRVALAYMLALFLLNDETPNVDMKASVLFRRTGNRAANRLADDILMPHSSLSAGLKALNPELDRDDILEIFSARFAVSMGTIETRLVSLGLMGGAS